MEENVSVEWPSEEEALANLEKDGEKKADEIEALTTEAADSEIATENQAKAIVKQNETSSVATNNNGYLVGNSLEEQYRLAKCYCQSGLLPKSYKTPAQVIVGMQYARELNLPPLMALKNIAVISGMPSLWGELPLALVRKSGLLEFIDEYFVDGDGKRLNFLKKGDDDRIWATVCEMKRKGEEKRIFTWTEDDVSKSIKGVAAIHKQYPKIMRKRKCRALAIKDVFPDVIGGMGIAEYDNEWSPERAQIVNPEAGPETNINEEITTLS